MSAKSLFLFSLFFTLLTVQSCAFFVNRFDKKKLEQESAFYKSENKKLYCEAGKKFQLVNSNPLTQEAFATFLERVDKKNSLKFVDKAVLWSLIQMNLRPDLASPTSKLQVFIKSSAGFDYFHFYSKEEGAFPYLGGLEHLLKKHKSRRSLRELSLLIDRYYGDIFTVDHDLEAFLAQNKSKISANPVLKRHYMRADESLKENERIPKYSLASIVDLYAKNKGRFSAEVANSLFSYQMSEGAPKALCNYDMKLYSNSVYLIHKEFIRSHLFGLKTKEGAFLASASQRLESIKPVNSSVFFKGASLTRSAAFCAFEFSKNHKGSSTQKASPKDMWMVSTDSRDPGQHIYHLLEFGMEAPSSLGEVSSLIGFSRHLFLEDPTRLIFESNRGTKEQLERLLALNLPVYNARSLGDMWAYYDNATEGFVVDERGDGQIKCEK